MYRTATCSACKLRKTHYKSLSAPHSVVNPSHISHERVTHDTNEPIQTTMLIPRPSLRKSPRVPRTRHLIPASAKIFSNLYIKPPSWGTRPRKADRAENGLDTPGHESNMSGSIVNFAMNRTLRTGLDRGRDAQRWRARCRVTLMARDWVRRGPSVPVAQREHQNEVLEVYRENKSSSKVRFLLLLFFLFLEDLSL